MLLQQIAVDHGISNADGQWHIIIDGEEHGAHTSKRAAMRALAMALGTGASTLPQTYSVRHTAEGWRAYGARGQALGTFPNARAASAALDNRFRADTGAGVDSTGEWIAQIRRPDTAEDHADEETDAAGATEPDHAPPPAAAPASTPSGTNGAGATAAAGIAVGGRGRRPAGAEHRGRGRSPVSYGHIGAARQVAALLPGGRFLSPMLGVAGIGAGAIAGGLLATSMARQEAVDATSHVEHILTGIGDALSGAFQKIGETLITAIAAALEMEGVGRIGNALLRLFTRAAGTVAHGLTEVLSGIAQAGVGTATLAAGAALPAVTLAGAGALGAAGFIGGAGAGLAGMGAGAVAALPTIGITALVGGLAVHIVASIVEGITKAAGRITDAVGRVFGAVVDAIGEVFAGIQRTFRDAVATATEYSRSIVDLSINTGAAVESNSRLVAIMRGFGHSPRETAGMFRGSPADRPEFYGPRLAMWGVGGVTAGGTMDWDRIILELHSAFQRQGPILGRAMLESLGLDRMLPMMYMPRQTLETNLERTADLAPDPGAMVAFQQQFMPAVEGARMMIDKIKIEMAEALLPTLLAVLDRARDLWAQYGHDVIAGLRMLGRWLYVEMPARFLGGLATMLDGMAGFLDGAKEWGRDVAEAIGRAIDWVTTMWARWVVGLRRDITTIAGDLGDLVGVQLSLVTGDVLSAAAHTQNIVERHREYNEARAGSAQQLEETLQARRAARDIAFDRWFGPEGPLARGGDRLRFAARRLGEWAGSMQRGERDRAQNWEAFMRDTRRGGRLQVDGTFRFDVSPTSQFEMEMMERHVEAAWRAAQ